LVASFFGTLGFLVAGFLARALAPKLVGPEPTKEQYQPGVDTRWEDLEQTWAVPLAEIGAAEEVRLTEQQGIAESGPFRRQVDQVDLLRRQTEEPWVVALRCPACGHALSVVDESKVFYCETCAQGVEYRGGHLRPVSLRFVEAEARGHVPHPFWVVRLRALCRSHGPDEWLPLPSEGPLDIYVPASRLPLSECMAQGVYLTHRQPRLRSWAEYGQRAVEDAAWVPCTVSREDALRLARLIYVALGDGPARHRRRLVSISIELMVFLSD
jgi:hypothetical protein